MKWIRPIAVLLLSLASIAQARAEATLFLAEPYSYDGALAGTGHAAVYLSDVCAETPVRLRLCQAGETGVVISRYHRIAGYDWIAIPLVPYLYAVEKQDDVPLFADKKMVAFLRDRYRRNHLETLIPDSPGGGMPDGVWWELAGASYQRTIYAYKIDTTREQDLALIHRLNNSPNRDHWNLVTANCADLARNIIDIYYPHSVHRSIVGDLGVTTPKQLASTFSKFSRHHPELHPSHFVITQVPGTLPRSKPNHNVVECALTAKKYMLPLFALHPVIAGSLIAGYLGHGHYDPSKNAPILDALNHFDTPPTREERRNFQNRLQELLQSEPAQTKLVSVELVQSELAHGTPLPGGDTPDAVADTRRRAALLAAAQPALDDSGAPTIQVHIGDAIARVGITRANILNLPEGFDFAADLVQARVREELKSSNARKTARADIAGDLTLLQQLLALQAQKLASSSGGAGNAAASSPAADQ
ncbi:MAG: hypothetical protein WAK29_17555 [Terriglobales bacterium]